MSRLYLVVHDGSQAHYAHMYIISLVGGMGPLMHLVHQSGAYSVERQQVYGHMNECSKRREAAEFANGLKLRSRNAMCKTPQLATSHL